MREPEVKHKSQNKSNSNQNLVINLFTSDPVCLKVLHRDRLNFLLADNFWESWSRDNENMKTMSNKNKF